jgi:hypothetical protein
MWRGGVKLAASPVILSSRPTRHLRMTTDQKSWREKHPIGYRAIDILVHLFLYGYLILVAVTILAGLYYIHQISIPEATAGIVSIVVGEGLLTYILRKRDKRMTDTLVSLQKTNEALIKTLQTLDQTNREILAELKRRR